jgi:hypothetical protein
MFRTCGRRPGSHAVVPAYAGLFPCRHGTCRVRSCCPRARGAVPGGNYWVDLVVSLSPRTRGSFAAHVPEGRGFGIVHAHAGIVRWRVVRVAPYHRRPRARGDRSRSRMRAGLSALSSLRTRGSFPPIRSGSLGGAVLLAHAGTVPRATRKRFAAWRRPAPARDRSQGPWIPL